MFLIKNMVTTKYYLFLNNLLFINNLPSKMPRFMGTMGTMILSANISLYKQFGITPLVSLN